MNILLSKETFTKNLMAMSFDKQFFGSEKNRILFGFNKNTNKSFKSCMGFLNGILKNWGLCVKVKKISQRIKKDIITTNYYYLSYDKIYNNYL